MDPATIFLVYAVGTLCLWLAGTSVRPAVEAVSRMGTPLPVGRRFTALLISVVLLLGMARVTAASGSVGPANQRVERMVDVSEIGPPEDEDALSQVREIVTTSSTHTVVKGESLWKIARMVLSSGSSNPSGTEISDLWRSIYDMNLMLIGEDPNLIHPGQVLQLPGR
jgi:nucleoid-associated protein YgaU